MFYKYTTDITYIPESGRKKDKQARTWVSPKRKKGEVLALFWHSVAIVSVYSNEILTQLPGTLTRPPALSDLASGSTGPNSSLQQPPLSHRRLSLTAANSSSVLGPCLSSSSSGLVRNLMHKPFVWVTRQNRQRNPLTGAQTHPQNDCPPSCYICSLNTSWSWKCLWQSAGVTLNSVYRLLGALFSLVDHSVVKVWILPLSGKSTPCFVEILSGLKCWLVRWNISIYFF